MYDFKHYDTAEHRKLTGAGNELILANLERLDATGIPIEIRMPIVPTLNDSPDAIVHAAEILGRFHNLTGIRLLPYHAFARSRYTALGHEFRMPPVAGPDMAAIGKLGKLMASRLACPVILPDEQTSGCV